MAKFKCVYTNSIYEFLHEHDIKVMKTHPEYVEVVEQEENTEVPAVKKAGRPPKASATKELEE